MKFQERALLLAACIGASNAGAQSIADIVQALKLKDEKASVTFNGGGSMTTSDDLHGTGYRHILSAKAGPIVLSSLMNVESGKDWSTWYGKIASARYDAGQGFQPGVAFFRRKDLATGTMKIYDCLDLAVNRQFKVKGVKIRAQASYLVPFDNPSDHFLVPQITADIPKLGQLRGFMNYVIKQDKRFYEGEWSHKVYEKNLSAKLKVRVDAQFQADIDFAQNQIYRAGMSANFARR